MPVFLGADQEELARLKQSQGISGKSIAYKRVRCPICSTVFCILSVGWVYRRRVGSAVRYLCSYSCAKRVDKLIDD